ncbi:calcium-binding protein [Streptomyces sp. TRM43335]|uniref:Calcium-binding protein n=1 Tax=Streptomyces taklimakanensis TaxID=2569853 RepID=A0A6G2B6U9_9ACTN|nr:calcium-binding protein [Streptomyces taklimakanensis]MTE17803.1 calcium-binding protein [Streptomyces taklimakanensis]
MRLRTAAAACALAALTALPPAGAALAQTDRGCADFDLREEAQRFFEQQSGDPSRLDADGDRQACENLPSAGGGTSGPDGTPGPGDTSGTHRPESTPGPDGTDGTDGASAPSGAVDAGGGGTAGDPGDTAPALALAAGLGLAAGGAVLVRRRRGASGPEGKGS